MKVIKEKPFIHDFKISSNEDDMPVSLGAWKNIDAAKRFVNDNFISEHVADVAQRYYSDDEISQMRLTVNAELEDERPLLAKKLLDATIAYENAKSIKTAALEAYNACITRAKDISDEIKSGCTSISIDPARSFRIAYNGKFYTYVYLDSGDLNLAKIAMIPEHELNNLFNSAQKNEESISLLKNGPAKTQKRAKK